MLYQLGSVPKAAQTNSTGQVVVVIVKRRNVHFSNCSFNFSGGVVGSRGPASASAASRSSPPVASTPWSASPTLRGHLPLLLPHLQPHLRLWGDLLRDDHDLVTGRLVRVDQPHFSKLAVSLSANKASSNNDGQTMMVKQLWSNNYGQTMMVFNHDD